MSAQDDENPTFLNFEFVDVNSDAETSASGQLRNVGALAESSDPKPGPSTTPIRSVPKGSGLAFFIEDQNSDSDLDRSNHLRPYLPIAQRHMQESFPPTPSFNYQFYSLFFLYYKITPLYEHGSIIL